ncbi:MAG TPA: HAD family hydrolase [Oscillospiraceae bacterium]|nr:HAD family hydrolase [Oscillospiraceae bacterium]HPK35993.1 HAD family hydrolase [Oscillospiraceae bacterium]HPR76324.1 HAD family hydrolase [Oscillospiraceae bacterium]
MQENNPVVALMYDFDKTLCTKDMQEYTFIPNIKMTAQDFWQESNSQAKNKKMDGILSYMQVMLEKAHAARQCIRREEFVKLGKDLEFFSGVESWFERINRIGNDLNVKVEHFIISSGLREIIEGSSIFNEFKEVFACEFLYDENDVACWPKNVVNYTTKTQFLFRINKGVLDISNDYDLNKYTPEDDRPVPFRNMIYIGDGLTDVPCMKLVKANGGYSIAVYQEGNQQKVADLLLDKRVDFIQLADYTKGSELDITIRDIICKMASVDSLKRKSDSQLKSVSKACSI